MKPSVTMKTLCSLGAMVSKPPPIMILVRTLKEFIGPLAPFPRSGVLPAQNKKAP